MSGTTTATPERGTNDEIWSPGSELPDPAAYRRRRHAVSRLRGHDGPMSLVKLADGARGGE